MGDVVRAWRPDVPGVREVLHASMTEHAYPAHTHDDWTVLLIDDGCVGYELDHRHREASASTVTLLPPHVPHDGRSVRPDSGFRKRVLYLPGDWLPAAVTGRMVDRPVVASPDAGRLLREAHAALVRPTDAWQAEGLLHSLRDLVLAGGGPAPPARPDPPLARRLRELLDAHLVDGITLEEAGRELHAHPGHLVLTFTTAYGMPPHRYLVGRRVDRARRLLLDGVPAGVAATEAGFFDQAHLTRHFRRTLGTTPGRFVAAA